MLPILGKELQGVKLNTGDKGRHLANFPDKFVPELIHAFQDHHNDTTDFSTPHIRTSLQSSYPFFIMAYVLVILGGVVANIAMLLKVLKIVQELRKKKVNFTEYLFLGNIALLNIIFCSLVMPLSLAILLIQNWVFGRLICYLVPIMQVCTSIIVITIITSPLSPPLP